MLKRCLERLQEIFSDKDKSKRMVTLCTYLVLGTIALFMTILNIITDKGWLTYSTGLFAALCAMNALLAMRGPKSERVAMALFSVEVLLMFTFFLVSGNPDGFSAIWICMLPSLGIFFFGEKRGAALSAAMLAVLVFLLWTPPGVGLLQYSYSHTFRVRFPILYCAFFATSFFLESLRLAAYRKAERLQDMYKNLSERDPLTGMLNRQGLYATLDADKEFRDINNVGAVMLDIDDFKDVNDRYGHNAGDEVLKAFAKIMSESLEAVVCRWGGEEFVAIYKKSRVERADVERLLRRIVEHEFDYGGDTPLKLTASLGVCEALDFAEKDIDECIKHADVALYEAKNTGKNRIAYFARNEQVAVPVPEQAAEPKPGRTREELLSAIKNSRFEMYLQFIYRAEGGKLIGAEVLSRWNHPKEGLLLPAQYMEDMRRTDVIHELDFYMLDRTCRQLERWKKERGGGLSLSCNFARNTFSRSDFLERFERVVKRYDFLHSDLLLEITEDSLINNKAAAYRNIVKCREMGLRVALDDIGSGYSSFNDLCDYPIDLLKIDRHIVVKAASKQGSGLLEGLVDLARRLKVEILCEGVETPEENEMVIRSGCDYIQGFYYSRVFPLERAIEYY